MSCFTLDASGAALARNFPVDDISDPSAGCKNIGLTVFMWEICVDAFDEDADEAAAEREYYFGLFDLNAWYLVCN